jgi:acylaminoacyl-peptidase
MVLFAALAVFAFAEDPSPDRSQLIDVFQLEYAADPQISPDGNHIVYARNFMDIMKDRGRSNLWILDADGSDHRPLTSGNQNDSSPRWSPDGKRLAYVSSTDGSAQIYCRWMDTGQTAKLTQLTSTPRGLTWSPDGSHLAFSMHVSEKAEPMVQLPGKPEGAEWAEPAKVIRKLKYRADGSGYLKDGYDQLFVLPTEGSTPRQMTTGEFNHSAPPAWTPDGKALIFSANRHPDWEYEPRNTEIYEVSLDTGNINVLTDRKGPDGSPAVSPDGKQIAYLGYDDRYQGYQVTRLYVMNRDGGGAKIVSKDLDRGVANPRWSRDGSGLFFQYDDEGNTKLAFISLDDKVDVFAENVGGLSIGRPYAGGQFSVADGGRFVFTESRPDYPADLAVGARGSQTKRVTYLNEDLFGHKELGQVEEIWYDSSYDGRKIHGWICKPPGFDPNRNYPLILEIHGGPFANYGDRFSAEVQLYAAAGYVVLYTNPRGSTSYGEEFGNLIHHAYPSQDYDDLMSGVDAVIAKGYVDENNLFVTGGSGGGVLTASKYWFPGVPWENLEHYMNRSPLHLAGNVKTPTMLLTGEADFRTPMSESEQFYGALKVRKVDAALVRIPGASHGIANRPSQLMTKVAHILEWFEMHHDKPGATDN